MRKIQSVLILLLQSDIFSISGNNSKFNLFLQMPVAFLKIYFALLETIAADALLCLLSSRCPL